MPALRAVLLDWGGVVADGGGYPVVYRWLGSHGLLSNRADTWAQTLAAPLMRGRNRLTRLGDRPCRRRTLTRRQLWPNPAVLELVRELQARGIKVGVVSNVMTPVYLALQAGGAYEGFDAVIASCHVGYAKPDARIYTIALKQLQVLAGQCIFVDDKQRCLDGAAALGMHTIRADNAAQFIRDIRHLVNS